MPPAASWPTRVWSKSPSIQVSHQGGPSYLRPGYPLQVLAPKHRPPLRCGLSAAIPAAGRGLITRETRVPAKGSISSIWHILDTKNTHYRHSLNELNRMPDSPKSPAFSHPLTCRFLTRSIHTILRQSNFTECIATLFTFYLLLSPQ